MRLYGNLGFILIVILILFLLFFSFALKLIFTTPLGLILLGYLVYQYFKGGINFKFVSSRRTEEKFVKNENVEEKFQKQDFVDVEDVVEYDEVE